MKTTSSGSHHLATWAEELEHLGLRQALARLHDHARERALDPPLVGHADHRGLGHLGVGHDLVLQLDRADPLAARLHQVLGAVDEADVALGADHGHVARAQPAVLGERLVGTRVVVVRRRDPRPAHLQLARGDAVPGELVAAVGRDDAHVDTGNGKALGGGDRRARRRAGRAACSSPGTPTRPGWSRSSPTPAGSACRLRRGSPRTATSGPRNRRRGWLAGSRRRVLPAAATRPSRSWARPPRPSPARTR